MKAIKNKLQSKRGASITFALLLFLVCAVISGVVIVAATTAAGRMSEQTDMDERYYAVTAVANKLIKEIDGKEVTLEYTKAAIPQDISEETVIAPTDLNGTEIFVAASKGVLKKTAMTIPADGNPWEFTKDDEGSVKCTLIGNLKNDGTLVFDIKAVTASNNRTYYIKLNFASTLKQIATDSSMDRATATVKWNLLGAEKWRPDRNIIAGG